MKPKTAEIFSKTEDEFYYEVSTYLEHRGIEVVMGKTDFSVVLGGDEDT